MGVRYPRDLRSQQPIQFGNHNPIRQPSWPALLRDFMNSKWFYLSFFLQSSPKPFDQIMDISGSTYMFFLHSCSIHGVDSQSDPWLWRSVKTRFKKPSKTSKKNSNSQLQKPQNLWETAMWRLARVGRLRRQSVRRFAAAPSVRRGWRWCSNWKSGFHYGLWSVWL